MREADLAAAMRLKAQAGWNQVEADWRFFLAQRPEGCFVATACAQDAACGQDAVVGTVTTVAYGPRLAWISMLLVDAAHRRQGIGTRLMQAAMESLQGYLSGGEATVALDATPAGRPLYERLGFRAERELVRLTRSDRFCLETCQVLSQQTCPVSEIAALDRRALGADRTALLRALRQRAPEVAYLAFDGGRPVAFCLGRHGSRLSQLGPVVAETLEQAIAVCRQALAAWEGRAAVLDVPASQETFLAWLREVGFEAQRPFTRMAYGAPLPQPTGQARTYAICGPEFG
jgi:ribosomal protein S18 acetylase RimI-like enzyme